MLLAWLVEHSLVYWYQQCVTLHHVSKCMSCQKAILVITERAHCFHNIYNVSYIYNIYNASYVIYIIYTYVSYLKQTAYFICNKPSHKSTTYIYYILIQIEINWKKKIRFIYQLTQIFIPNSFRRDQLNWVLHRFQIWNKIKFDLFNSLKISWELKSQSWLVQILRKYLTFTF